MKKMCKIGFCIFLLCSFFKYGYANEENLRISNIGGVQFTASWVTTYPCSGKLLLKDPSGIITEYLNTSNTCTHYVVVNQLKENTHYTFSIVSGEIVDDNNGKMYHVVTGPEIIPVGSLQPAGQVFGNNGKPATGAIVYIKVYNDDVESALMSTQVDKNGYWFFDLVNTRTLDNQHLFNPSESDQLEITVVGKKGRAFFKGNIMDNNFGTKLYSPLILN